MLSTARTTDRVLMIRPSHAASNPETLESNAFQTRAAPADAAARARVEFDEMVEALVGAGVTVHVFDDDPERDTPDAVFPNNWLSFHDDGVATLYPMFAPNRRREVRPELIDRLTLASGLRWPRVVDLTPLVDRGAFIEGTGSVVLDRAYRVAFAARSPRTTDEGLVAFSEALGYEVVAFDASDGGGGSVYHTNVMMAIGDGFVVCCMDSVAVADRDRLNSAFDACGLEIVPISEAQRDAFAGNMLALRSGSGDPLLVMSSRAFGSLSSDQRRALEKRSRVVSADLETIEAIGGGSARCMICEVFGVGG